MNNSLEKNSNKPIRTATGFWHWPVVEQLVTLFEKMELKWHGAHVGAIFLYGLFLFFSFLLIVGAGSKRISDWLSLFVIYIATLMLALPPEDKSQTVASELQIRQKKHVRFAVGVLVFGTLVQFASFHLDGKNAVKEKDEKKKAEKVISGLEERLNNLEKERKMMAEELKRTTADLASQKTELANIKMRDTQAKDERHPLNTGLNYLKFGTIFGHCRLCRPPTAFLEVR